MKCVGIYIDAGANFEILMRAVAGEIAPDETAILPLTAGDIVHRKRLSGCRALIMPGGADLPYCRDLNGPGVEAIRSFVAEGGGFLGICASAYFACNALEFHKGSNGQIVGPRELALLQAVAVGSLPELGPSYDLTIASASAARLDWEGLGRFRGYYHGGPTFVLDEDEHAEVIATYVDAGSRPAVISKKFGEGRVILSGVHLEMNAEALHLKTSSLEGGGTYRHLVTLVSDSEKQRRSAFRRMLEGVGIPLIES